MTIGEDNADRAIPFLLWQGDLMAGSDFFFVNGILRGKFYIFNGIHNNV